MPGVVKQCKSVLWVCLSDPRGPLNMHWGEGMLATLPVSEGRPLRGAKESTEASRAVSTLWSAQVHILMVYSIQRLPRNYSSLWSTGPPAPSPPQGLSPHHPTTSHLLKRHLQSAKSSNFSCRVAMRWHLMAQQGRLPEVKRGATNEVEGPGVN